jgi:hypothetical protein
MQVAGYGTLTDLAVTNLDIGSCIMKVGWGFSIEVDKAAETRLEDLIGLRINIELL